MSHGRFLGNEPAKAPMFVRTKRKIPYQQVPDAAVLKFEGYEAIEFFAHPILVDFHGDEPEWHHSSWGVSEAISGNQVCEVYISMDEDGGIDKAIAKAEKILAGVTPERIILARDVECLRVGPTPYFWQIAGRLMAHMLCDGDWVPNGKQEAIIQMAKEWHQ